MLAPWEEIVKGRGHKTWTKSSRLKLKSTRGRVLPIRTSIAVSRACTTNGFSAKNREVRALL